MARINASSGEQIFRITSWKGLNENPDGDTKLKSGESSICTNWQITRDGNLCVRPGTKNVCGLMPQYKLVENPEEFVEEQNESFAITLWPEMSIKLGMAYVHGEKVKLTQDVLAENPTAYNGYYFFSSKTNIKRKLINASYSYSDQRWTLIWHNITSDSADGALPVRGLWSGNVAGDYIIISCCAGKVYRVEKNELDWTREEVGNIDTSREVSMFGFSGKLYFMNGKEYKCYDGETLYDVTGYRPLVAIAVPPAGGGTALEQINKLNGLRRCWISPTGTDETYQLPEKNIKSVDWVKNRATGEALDSSSYTYDLKKGTVTFTTAPDEGTDTYEIAWTYGENFRSQVTSMRYAELFSGTTDNRVFIYGDGSNKAFYSDIDYDGYPNAEYFPDMNVLDVGEDNTPITSLIKHYSRLIAYKTHSAYSIQYSEITLPDGNKTAAFYTKPINRSIGNEAAGQVQLILNDPVTLHGKDIYLWKNNNAYSSNLTVDERQARRISDRVSSTLSRFYLPDCICYDDNYNQEYYIVSNGNALVWNYAIDAWYNYTNFPAKCMVSYKDELYFGSDSGYLVHVSNNYRNDNGEPIHAMWRSGSMNFYAEWLKKYTLRVFIGIKPDIKNRVEMYVNSDRESEIGREDIEVVSINASTFIDADFSDFSFNTSSIPNITRHKLKARKYAYCQLVLRSDSADTTAKITSVDITVRNTGYVK